MRTLRMPNRLNLALAAAIVGGLATSALPAAADGWDDDDGYRRHHHRHHGGKQVFYDGPCRVERKWGDHGGYKEKVQCAPAYHGYAYGPPPVVYYQPPPAPPVYYPTISVVIPLGR